MKIPVWKTLEHQLLADLETPVSAFLKLQNHGAMALLETVERGVVLGRYSLIALEPLLELECFLDRVTLVAPDGERFESRIHGDPLALLRTTLNLLRRTSAPVPGDLLGGAVGYVSYEYIRCIEPVPVHEKTPPAPLARFVIPQALVTFDHLTHKMFVRTMGPSGESEGAAEEPGAETVGRALRHAAAIPRLPELPRLLEALRQPLPAAAPGTRRRSFTASPHPDPAEYQAWVRRAKGFIEQGDIFQVVLSQTLRGTPSVPPFEVYRALRVLNPSPYLFFLDLSPTVLVGSSPEVLVKLEGADATVRPIAGTRPRGATAEQDRELEQDLLKDEKECAEHVMLVDLGRNDLGRVCRYGSVKVTSFQSIERYSHVMHMVSYVRGQLREGLDRFDLLRAVFPAGTVSGAPKIRALEIVHDLEGQPRGPYAGALGYFGPSGEMDLCITIRTIFFEGELAVLQAGAGIVADSDPEREHQECRRKMAALTAAIELAEGGLA